MFSERGITVDKDFKDMTDADLQAELAGFDAWFVNHGEDLIAGQPVFGPDTISVSRHPQPVG